MKNWFLILGLLLALSAPAPTSAQQISDGIPTQLAADVVSLFNDPSVLRLEGRASLPFGSTVQGPVALVAGELVVEGVVQGDVVLLDADLRIGAEGRIEGDVLIIGGRLRTANEDQISGTLTQFAETFRWAREGEVLAVVAPTFREQRGIRLLGSRISIRGGSSYNRVEGLPILFGPVIESSGPNPIYLEGMATFRTETGLTDDELGFRILLERRWGRPTRFAAGVSAYSEVTPIESWGIGDLEASMTTFLLHRDYRDYFERHGWSAHVGANLADFPLRLRLTYRDEKHFSLSPSSPWTLKENDRPWRPLPLVGEGDARFIDLDFEVDERNNREDPSDGWYLKGRLSYGLTGDLLLPSFSDHADFGISNDTESLPNSFSSGFLDLRRYARVDPTSALSLRAVFAGSLNDRPLPPQFQHVLGGEGSLPGFGPLSLDCGARDLPVFVRRSDGTTAPTFARYGCERVALFQTEFRKDTSFSFDLGQAGGWVPNVSLDPSWIAFFNVGRGWSDTVGGTDFEDRADLGAGLEIGSLGAYWAYPLNGNGKLNFFVRLQRRF